MEENKDSYTNGSRPAIEPEDVSGGGDHVHPQALSSDCCDADKDLDMHPIAQIERLRSETGRLRQVAFWSFLVVAGTNVAFVFGALDRFLNKDVAQVGQYLTPFLERTTQVNMPRARSALNHVVGHYAEALSHEANVHGPHLFSSLVSEAQGVEGYFSSQWPVVNNMVTIANKGVEDAVVRNLQNIANRELRPEEAAAIRTEVKTALADSVTEHLNWAFSTISPEFSTLRRNIGTILDREPDLKGYVDGEQTVGMFFELIGLEAQLAASQRS